MKNAKKGLTIIDLYYLKKELSELVGSRLNQAYQTSEFIELDLFKTGGNSYTLMIDLPNWIFLSKKKQIHSERPPAFSGFLRKNLKGSFITKIDLKQSERIIEIVFSKKNEEYKAYIELIPPGNMIICDLENKILLPSSTKQFSNRTIKKGENYVPMIREYNIFEIKKEDFIKIIKLSKKSLVKSLATEIGIGGNYSEEILLRCKIDKNQKELSDENLSKIYLSFRKILNQKPEPKVYLDDEGNVINITPFPFQTFSDMKSKGFETFSDAIEFFMRSKKPVISKEQERHYEKIKKLKSIISVQEESIAKIKYEIAKLSEIPDKLYSDYAKINEIINQIMDIFSKKDFSKIEQLKEKYKIINSIDLKNRKLILNI